MAEESSPSESQSESVPPTDKPKRTRRTKQQMAAAQQAALAELPAFDPTVVDGHFSATAKRTVRTGSYESFEILVHADFERDPRLSVRENIQKLGGLVTQECNQIADDVRRTIVIEK